MAEGYQSDEDKRIAKEEFKKALAEFSRNSEEEGKKQEANLTAPERESKKRRTPLLSAKKVLTPKQYEEYIALRQEQVRQRKFEQMNKLRSQQKFGAAKRTFRNLRRGFPKPMTQIRGRVSRRVPMRRQLTAVEQEYPTGLSVAMDLERGIWREQGSIGLAHEGDAAAIGINRQASNFANGIANSPAAQIEAETNFHARNQHINPINQIENEVFALANMIDTQPRIRKGSNPPRRKMKMPSMESLIWDTAMMIDRKPKVSHKRRRK